MSTVGALVTEVQLHILGHIPLPPNVSPSLLFSRHFVCFAEDTTSSINPFFIAAPYMSNGSMDSDLGQSPETPTR